jgi:hypothetical protein
VLCVEGVPRGFSLDYPPGLFHIIRVLHVQLTFNRLEVLGGYHRLQATGACNNAAGGPGLRSMGRHSASSWGSLWMGSAPSIAALQRAFSSVIMAAGRGALCICAGAEVGSRLSRMRVEARALCAIAPWTVSSLG